MRVDVVGTGLGPNSVTLEGREAISAAELLIGSPRLIEDFSRSDQQTIKATRPSDVIAAIEAASAERIVVLMSGDVGYHSGATKIAVWQREKLPTLPLRLIPGVSTISALAARVGLAWEDAALISCHGIETDLVSPVRRNQRTIALTGGNVSQLAASLIEADFGRLTVWIGENLGLATESVTQTTIDDLASRDCSSLTTLLIENPSADARIRTGIPDEEFARGKVPMTKSAVRAVSVAQLAIEPADICYDVGCGTGSVTVELALSAYSGQVFAIDKNPEAIELTRANCREFHLGNVTVEEGFAPEGLADWPNPDVVFIGGTTGSMQEIVELVVERNPNVRIVVTAIAVESVTAALTALKAVGLTPKITQLSVAEGRAVGGLHLMIAQNPVTIISGGRDG